MRILVTGPTGRTGSHVIDALRARDPDVLIRGLCRYPDAPLGAIETVPGNPDTGGTQAAAVETVPGNPDTGARLMRAVETVPGNPDTGARLMRAVETVPGNPDTGARLMRAVETVPGNPDTGGRRAHMVECQIGDLEDPAARALAMEGVDVVIHYAPAFHPREAAMGTGMIDAAAAAGVTRFIYVSALHAEVASVPGHAAKLAVEGYLAESALEWTVLRPQTYMQNVDVAAVHRAGVLELPFPLDCRQGYLDLADLAAVIAKVTFEDGHALATYELAGTDALGTAEIAALVSTLSGALVTPRELPLAELVARLQAAGPGYGYVGEAISRLNAWQVRSGGRGNANVLRWLLGREPGRFEDYVRRNLSGPNPARPAGQLV